MISRLPRQKSRTSLIHSWPLRCASSVWLLTIWTPACPALAASPVASRSTPHLRVPIVAADTRDRPVADDVWKGTEFAVSSGKGRIEPAVAQINAVLGPSGIKVVIGGQMLVIATLILIVVRRRKAEAAMREREAHYRLLAENTSDVIWTMDLAGRFSYFSPSVERLLGFSPKEALRQTIEQSLTPASAGVARARLNEIVALAAAGQSIEPGRIELEHVRKDGSKLWAELSYQGITGSSGEVAGILGVTREVTDRRRAVDELRDRERRLQQQNNALLSLMSRGALFQPDLQRAIAEITEACSDLIEVERVSVWLYEQDCATIHCIDLFERSSHRHSGGEELRSAEFPAYTTSHQRGAVIAAADVYADPRTREIPAEYYREHDIHSLLDAPVWMRDRLGGILSFEHVGGRRSWTQEDERLATDMAALLSICFEVNDRRRAEEALRRSEARLRTIGDNLPKGMIYEVIVHPDGTRQFTYVSAAVESLHGCTADQVMADASVIYDGIVEEDRERIREEETRAICEFRMYESELRIRMKSGDVRWRHVISRPRRTENGELVFDGLEMDVTERKRAEQEKTQLEAQLLQVQKLEAVGQLSAGLAHDFGNILTTISGCAELADRLAADPTKVRQLLGDIQDAVGQASEITRSLLTFSRTLPAEETILDLRIVIEEVRALIRHGLSKRIALDIEFGSNRPLWVRGDRTRLHQVLLNLAVNSRDAMPDGGTLRIRAEHANWTLPSRDEMEQDAPTDAVKLLVSDTGIGIPDEIQERIFEPFFSTKARGRGTGLGLSIVHGIVNACGGTIEVDSVAGQGATFTIMLPLADAPETKVAGPGRLQLPDGHREQVLVAVGDPMVRGVITSSLSASNYLSDVATDFGEAVDLLVRHGNKVRAMILDLGLASRSALPSVEALQRAARELPTILLPGDDDMERGWPDTAQVCAGPFTIARLLELLSERVCNPRSEKPS